MERTAEGNFFRRIFGRSRAAGLFTLLVLACLSAPAMAQDSCNPETEITASPPGPFLVPSSTITIILEIGAGTISGGTSMTIANVDYALDCENDGVLPCADDGGQMSYGGDASITTTCTDGMNPVTWVTGHPGGTTPNDITFVPSSPVVVGANSTCNLSFGVQILAPSDDATPGLVEVAHGYPGVCDNDLTANAGGTAAFSTVVPSIAILKEISVDGGTTWFDANDPGSAPSVPFPSGALYRLTVENTGDVTIDNVVVNDATLGIVNHAVGTLTAGQVVVLTQAEIPELSVAERCSESGEFENVAQVSGDPAAQDAEPVTDEDPAWLVCTGVPDIEIIKEIFDEELGAFVDANTEGTAPVVTAPSGALYRLTVTNTGTSPLENVVINDSTLGIVDFAVGTLAIGETRVLTETEIPALSVAERCSEEGVFTNTSDVAGTSVETGEVVTDNDPAVLVCEAGLAQFRVVKDFEDDNPMGVEVFISCNTGLPLEQSKVITEGEENGVTFVVTDFTSGEMDCDIFEEPLQGYSTTYTSGGDSPNFSDDEGCHYTEVEGGDFNTCFVFNELDPVIIIVHKIWIDPRPEFQNPMFAEAFYQCFNTYPPFDVRDPDGGNGVGDSGFLFFEGQEDQESFLVFPHWNGETFCTVEERVDESGVETDDSDCERLPVTPGNGNECTIFNTRLFEGIPTLSRHGVTLLALLMLGVGLIAYRRFA